MSKYKFMGYFTLNHIYYGFYNILLFKKLFLFVWCF